jgi:hypothetical protein
MRRSYALPSALLGVLLALPCAAAGDEPAPPAPGEVVARIAGLLPLAGPVGRLQAALGGEPHEVRDLDFSGTWRRWRLDAGAATLLLDVATHGRAIVATRIRSLGGSDAWKRQVQAVWGAAARVHARGVEYRHEDERGVAAWRAQIERVLGEPSRRGVPAAFVETLRPLLDPLSDLTFGHACTEDGSPPAGRREIDRLRQEPGLVCLDLATRSPNPEARAYAAEALLVLQTEGTTLGAARERVIEAIRALPSPIRTCRGCLVLDELAAEVLAPEQVGAAILCRVVHRVQAGGAWQDVAVVRVYANGDFVFEPGAGRTPLRGLLPDEVLRLLRDAVRSGEGFLVDLGTPTYVLHGGDASTGHPEGIERLRDHLAVQLAGAESSR